MSGEDLLQTLQAAYTSQNAPKATFAFGQSGFTSTDGFKALGAYDTVSLPNLKANLETTSSVTIPYSYLPSVKALRRANPTATESTRTFTSSSTCTDFTSYIQTAINAAGSRSALILAQASDKDTLAVVDKCLPQITATLATATGNKFVTAVVGIPTENVVENVSFLETSSTIKAAGQLGAAGPGYEGPKYITGQTIFALLVSFFLLLAAWIGFQCTMSIEIPFRYAQPYHLLPATKEY